MSLLLISQKVDQHLDHKEGHELQNTRLQKYFYIVVSHR
jgi:hypothetical protein